MLYERCPIAMEVMRKVSAEVSGHVGGVFGKAPVIRKSPEVIRVLYGRCPIAMEVRR